MTMTRLWNPLRAALLLSLLAGLLVAACGGDDDDADNDTNTMTDHSMMTATDADVDPDLAFIDGMIVHHESAVAMAELAADLAEHEEIGMLASDIIAAQTAEIEQLQTWRDEWFPDAPETDLSGMLEMPGMNMSEDDMQMLRDADSFDAMFIDMMIPHHEAAIDMAGELQDETERRELQELASAIITAQQAEIQQMREWRDAWFETP
jgi:uncharacterized protein (DUF305 family)